MATHTKHTNHPFESLTIAYGDLVNGPAKDFPPASIQYLIDRGCAHTFGNQAASRVTALKAKRAKEFDDALKTLKEKEPNEPVEGHKAIAEAALGHDGTYNDAEVATMLADVQAEFLSKLLAGTMGEGRVGPQGDPVDREVKRLAEIAVKAKITKKGIAISKVENLADLIADHAKKHDATLRPQAIANIEAEKALRQVQVDDEDFNIVVKAK